MAVLAGSLLCGTLVASAAGADGAPVGPIDGMPTVVVHGGPIANITSTPLALSPAYDQNTTDYVWRCAAGTNSIALSLSALPGHTIKVGAERGSSITLDESLAENQALVIVAINPPGHRGAPSAGPAAGWTQYWFRCLPHDFPRLTVTRTGPVPKGWYLTGNLTRANGSGAYSMVLDSNGTPVWYQNAGEFSQNLTLLGHNELAWVQSGNPGVAAFEDMDLNTGSAKWLIAPLPSMDFHELHPMANGDLLMLSNPPTPNIDLSAVGGPSSAWVYDCVFQEVTRSGVLVWQWRATDHLTAGQATHVFPVNQGGRIVYDVFHCNGADTNATSTQMLISARATDAVYLIDMPTGTVQWKLGGNSVSDGAEHVVVTGDPEGTFQAQHDARFEPNGGVSLFDDQSWAPSKPARGIEYHIDAGNGTAWPVWSSLSPDGMNSACTGSFRRLAGGNDNVIGWGCHAGELLTEVDRAGKVLLSVSFTDNQLSYRVVKVPVGGLTLQSLRTTAGVSPTGLTTTP